MIATFLHASSSYMSLLFVFLLCLTPLIHAGSNGTFFWPSSTQQCNTYNVTIYNGVPPWTLVLAPINGQPIYWNISAPPRYDPIRSVTAQVPLQLTAGTAYTVFVKDSTGYFGGVNPIEVQTVGVGSSSSCLDDVISHVHDFTFTASGSTQQCGSDFALSWVDMLGIGPYNYTVLPLDTSTSPFDVVLKGGPTTTGETGWAVNMTAGTRFTIMMNNLYGAGRGGIGGIYQVAPGSTNSCITAPVYTTSAWPAGLQTNTLLTAAALPTSVITSRSVRAVSSSSSVSLGAVGGSDTMSSTPSRDTVTVTSLSSSSTAAAGGGGLSTGAAAGIGAGIGCAAIALIAGLIFWWLRRKRSARSTDPRQVDLASESRTGPASGYEAKVEPYPSPTVTPGLNQAPEMAYHPTADTDTGHQYPNPFTFGAAATGAAGSYAALNQASQSSEQLSPGRDRFSITSAPTSSTINPYFPPETGAGGGVSPQSPEAGPLPSKSNAARQSYQPSIQAYGMSGAAGARAGQTSPLSPSSISGSSSSGRALPAIPGGPRGSVSASDTEAKAPSLPPGAGAGASSGASNAGTTGHAAPMPFMSEAQPGQAAEVGGGEVEFRRHQDAETVLPPQQESGVVDLPPLYQDVPQRRGDSDGQSPH